MPFSMRLALLCLLISFTAACAKMTAVTLVPDPEDRVGRVSVTNQAGTVALSAAYQGTTIVDAKTPPVKPKRVDREKLQQTFSDAFSVQPTRALRFFFYFLTETTPTPKSLEMIEVIVAAIRQRNSAYVSVVGHADTLGTGEYNIDVTMRRALVVRDLLVEHGAVVTIYPSWVGEQNLLVPTEDEVWEPKNRMVEVIIR